MTIVRTPTKAAGGITDDEKNKLEAVAAEWIKLSYRTGTIEPEKITHAIHGIYAAAGLKAPRNGTIVEGVPRTNDIDGKPINTAIAAQAWRDGLPTSEYQHPTMRT